MASSFEECERLVAGPDSGAASSDRGRGRSVLDRVLMKKSIASVAHDRQESELGPVLTLKHLIFLGVGMVIGAGIFTLVGKAARAAGPSLVLSFAMVSVASLFIALCYSELASCIPISGSAYSYIYVLFGEIAAWFVGWNLILEYTVAAAVIARAWTGYLSTFLRTIGIAYPNVLVHIDYISGSSAHSEDVSGGESSINITAAAMLFLLTLLLMIGIRESAQANMVVVTIKVSVLLFFITLGFVRFNPGLYSDFFPKGITGTFTGGAVIFFAYLGFDGVSSLAEEARDPVKDMPRAIVGTLLICSVLYTFVGAVIVGLVPYDSVSLSDPLADAFRDSTWAEGLVAFAAVAGITTAMLGSILGQARIFFSMARDGLLPPFFSHVNERNVPLHATWLSGLAAILLALFVEIDVLGSLTSIGGCSAFVLVCAAVMQRRFEPVEGHHRLLLRLLVFIICFAAFCVAFYVEASLYLILALLFLSLGVAVPVFFLTPAKLPDTGGFLCPFVPFVPMMGICTTLIIMIGQGTVAFVVYGAWVVFGMVVYFAYGYRNSHLAASFSTDAAGAAPDENEPDKTA